MKLYFGVKLVSLFNQELIEKTNNLNLKKLNEIRGE